MSKSRVQILAITVDFRASGAYMAPYFDSVKREFLVGDKVYKAKMRETKKGQEFYTDESPIPLTDETQFKLDHEMVFDTDDAESAFMLQMAMDSGYVAKNLQSVNRATEHRFYLKDEETEGKEKASKADRGFEAMTLVRNLKQEELYSFAFYMKQPARQMTAAMIEGYVKELAIQSPDVVLDALGTKTWKVRAFLQKAVDFNLIKLTGGVYKVGSEVIGTDVDTAIAYLRGPEGRTFTGQLKEKIAQLEGKAVEREDEVAVVKESK